MRILARWLAAALLVAVAAAPADAALHFMAIQEVFVGPPSDGTSVPLAPDQRAQYVMLRMTSSGQNFVGGSSIRVEDADGRLLGTFGAFTTSVSNGGMFGCSYPSCPAVILGTQAADDLFTFSFDKVVNGQASRVALPTAGGRVCFLLGSSVYDCVAWGNFDCSRSGNCVSGSANTLRAGDFNGNGCDTNYGTPAASGGLGFGRALVRTSFNCAAKENSTQFALSFPKPVNNGGSHDNVDTDADGLIDALDCDDTPGTGAAFLWPVADLQNLRMSANPVTLSYSQAATSGSGATHDLVRGTLAALNGFTDAVCLDPDGGGTVADPDNPAVGNAGFYYVARASSSAACGGAGTYGPGRAALDAICP